MQTQTKPTLSLKIKNRDLKNLMLGEIDKALEVAFFYGFVPIKRPLITKNDLELSKSPDTQICNRKIDDDLERCHRLDNKICILRSYVEGNFRSLPQPLMISFRDRQKSVSANNSLLNLSIIGAHGSIAEAVAIKTSLAILSEQNYRDISVEINSVGDRDSFSRFEKDLHGHVKKNFESIPQTLSEEIKKDPQSVLHKYSHEENDGFWQNAPKPLNYLSPASIKHFQEVLEYLESLEIPYNLNHYLLPNKNICHQTVFQIRNSGVLVAVGVRHQNVIRRLSLRKEVPFLTVALRDGLCLTRKIKTESIRPKFFLVQFGNKAKIKSLIVIETLRKSGIPIYHLLTRDKLIGQLSMAESLNFSYLLIIGEKEAIENSVVVRNIESRVQETVPMNSLAGYLRKIKI